MEKCESTNNIETPVDKANNSKIIILKTRNNNQSNIIIEEPVEKANDGKIIILKTRNNNQSNTINKPLKLNILTPNSLISSPKPIKLLVINKVNYEDNILFFNSIINEAKSFLESVPEMMKMIPPITIYEKEIKYNFDVFVNKSREKFGLIFDYSLTNPKNVTCSTSEVTTRCMICTYKQTTNVRDHFRKADCIKCSNRCKWYYEIFIYASFLIHGDKFIYPIMERDKKITTAESIDVICKKYKHITPVSIKDHIHSKSGCLKCYNEERTWNYDKLMDAVVRVHGYKYDYSKVIPSEIISNECRFIVICNICDYEWSPILSVHINQGSGCPSCAGQLPWTYERLLIAAFRIHGNKYYYGLVRPEDIQSLDSRINLCCNKCNYYWNPIINDHINGKTGCPSCARSSRWTYDFFIENTRIVHGNKYSYELVNPEDINGGRSMITIICLTCKYQWSTTINTHINSRNCQKCLYSLKHTLDNLVNKITEIHENKFDCSLIRQEHIKCSISNVPLICNKCKKCWSPTINSLINGKRSGCPRCRTSKGERACIKYLLSNNIAFEEQFKILELGMKRFDFMVEYDGLKYVMEFDGAQQFKFV
jgi:hypothetical protein